MFEKWKKHRGVIERNGETLYIHLSWCQILSLFEDKKYGWEFEFVQFQIGRFDKFVDFYGTLFGVHIAANLRVPFLKGRNQDELNEVYRRLLGDDNGN